MRSNTALLATLAIASPALAVPIVTNYQHLDDPTGLSGQGFAVYTALAGNTLFVFSNDNQNPAIDNGGSAFVYERFNGEWQYKGALTYPNDPAHPDDTHNCDLFGTTLAFDGTTLAVGAPGDGLGGECFDYATGAIHTFVKIAGQWTHYQEVPNPDLSFLEYFGMYVVAIEGDTMYARSSVYGSDASILYTYSLINNLWTPVDSVLMPTNAWQDPRYAAQGNTFVFGQPGNDDLAQDSGTVHIYEYDGTSLNLVDQLYPSGPDLLYSKFGNWITIEGDHLFVGAVGDRTYTDSPTGSGHGAFYIYKRTPEGWAFQQKLFPDVPHTGQSFGHAVVHNGVLAATCRFIDANEPGLNGAVFVYREHYGTWRLAQTCIPDDTRPGNIYYGPSISDDTIVVATTGHGTTGEPGTVYLFDVPPAFCTADVDADGDNDPDDLNAFVNNFTDTTPGNADADGDGDEDPDDINAFVAAFVAGC